jgi:NCAIR mutase (PurE)-related protein
MVFLSIVLIMNSLREILDKVAKNEISPSEAEKILKLFAVDEVGCLAKIDGNRELRKGLPEIVLAEGIIEITEISKNADKKGRVIISRCTKKRILAR